MEDSPALTEPQSLSGINQETPHTVDAERAVLGALMINNELFTDITTILKTDYLYDNRHQVIYDSMATLYSEKYVDPLILTDRLRSNGKLREAGSEEYIAELADIGAAPTNVRAYAELIRDKAFLRQLISAHHDSSNESFHPGDKTPSQLLDTAEARLSHISDMFRTGENRIGKVRDISRAYSKKIFDNHKDMTVLRGIHPGSGFERLYKQTQGLHNGDLIILAGRPGAGKTAFGLNLVRNISKQENIGVLCFSLEMSAEQLVMRMLSHHGLDMHKMRSSDTISSHTMAQLAAASSKLEEQQIYIDDSGTLNILEARTRARRVKREMEKEGYQLGLIMVDYLQLMDAPSGNNRYDSRALEVSFISRGLKALAKELNTPIVALSQLNRGSEKRADTRPVMSDLRESGAIEQDADLILFLHSKNEGDPEMQDSVTDVQLIIGKQRNGPTGTIKLKFDKPLSTFREAEPDAGTDNYEN